MRQVTATTAFAMAMMASPALAEPPATVALPAAAPHGAVYRLPAIVAPADHTFRLDDPQGKLTPRGKTSFRWVPNGIPGVGARLPILFSEGVMKGRIDINKFVAVTSTNHAKTYGLYPRKGTIAVGADADITIWDPEIRQVLTHSMLGDGADYTPYEGLEITGWPILTMVRCKVVVRDGQLSAEKGIGTYLSREVSSYV